jgi:hypothetical protein
VKNFSSEFSTLAAGLYILRLEQNGKGHSVKFVKNNL